MELMHLLREAAAHARAVAAMRRIARGEKYQDEPK